MRKMAYINGEHCCNCQYWNGPRKVSVFKDKSDVKSMGNMGICLNKRSNSTKGKEYRADKPANCNHFEKWEQLK